ncbi:hypothetical protein SPONN_1788 [uncultured Candidatus Thioglobus sp.]|nr:hypothetical protein SPONN_1788 [uncultured Candidatus Thioglobus sp.]
MPGFIEKTFLKFTQYLSLLLAIIMLIVAGTIGYNQINIKSDKSDKSDIQFSDYQQLIRDQEKNIGKNLEENKRFNQVFNTRIDNIVSALNNMSDKVVDKTDLKQRVIISTKAKLAKYPQSLQLSYVKSLARLTKQIANVGAEVDMDDLTKWHDQYFLQQAKAKDESNFLQIGQVQIEKSAYLSIREILIAFMLLVIILAVLRIEKNTRTGIRK